MLIEKTAFHIQHMQKAISQMNIQLHNVIGDTTGKTGLKIIRAIIQGERDAKVLANYRDYRCKNPLEIIEKSLKGSYRDEHIFSLQQAVDLYDYYHNKIQECDDRIEKELSKFETKKEITEEELSKLPRKRRSGNKHAPRFNLQAHLIRLSGVNLTAIPGIDTYTGLKIISEIGLNMNRWKTGKQFASWLGICPGNQVSGGKQLSGKSKRTSNRVAAALRIAASTLYKSHSALGAFLRRLKSRLGSPKAITATAHKLALIVFNMLKYGQEYFETGQNYYEQQYRKRLVKSLNTRARELGFLLIEAPISSNT